MIYFIHPKLYSKINYNEIKITVKIKKNEINKKIYFLDKTDGKIVVGLKENLNSLLGFDDIKEEHHHDYIKELLYINNEKYKYKKYFIPEKEGNYNILLKFNILLNDCNFMFCD